MKIIFLDIDGVLNRKDTKERCGPWMGVDRRLSSLFVNFVAQHDVDVVLSSTWRRNPEMWDHLHKAGIHWIDQVPIAGRYRGYEIQMWLDNRSDVMPYCILDDLSPAAFMKYQRPFHVQPNSEEGLTTQDLEKVKKILDIS